MSNSTDSFMPLIYKGDLIIIGARNYSKTQRSWLGYFPMHLHQKNLLWCGRTDLDELIPGLNL
jgi:hypothetical protein